MPVTGKILYPVHFPLPTTSVQKSMFLILFSPTQHLFFSVTIAWPCFNLREKWREKLIIQQLRGTKYYIDKKVKHKYKPTVLDAIWEFKHIFMYPASVR